MIRNNKTVLISQVLIVVISGVSRGTADVFSSSLKMLDLSRSEGLLLDKFQRTGVDYESSLQNFVEARREARSLTGGDASSHPNGAYLLIKAFVGHWNNLINARTDLKEVLGEKSQELPSSNDLDGTLAALLRLHRVYRISAAQLYSGNISGFTGPRLTPGDALALGRRAFTDAMLNQSVEWLTLAYDSLKQESPGVGVGIITDNRYDPKELAQVVGILGRTYLRLNNRETATRLYHESALLADIEGDANELAKELGTNADFSTAANYDMDPRLDGMHVLCTRSKEQIVERLLPFHRCRYKPSLHVPYRKYKEEILNLSPYASIFHDAVTVKECDYLKELALSRLKRAGVYYTSTEQEQLQPIHYRTAELGWIGDADSPVVRRVSRRVMDMTWLEANDRNNSNLASAELMQVLNYGLGGHFSTHLDAYHDSSQRVMQSGIRIATFLMYLEDVELGGHTTFVDAGLSVPPVKGQGLFWYNGKPNGEIDPHTVHAGCPVLKGQKWIANKWIWTEGNMYRRPCGPRPESTQLTVEKITYSRRHNIPFP